jgi:aspartate kinase
MSFGERLSTRIVADALRAAGTPAQPVNAYEIGLMTDGRHGSAAPLPGIEREIAGGLGAVTGVPVVTGFLGRTERGEITTLGRSGSDYSAAILGAALGAEEVQIWTDVSGIMTCDPSVDASAQSLPQLSFNEASELAYYGAEVLHPSTLVPAIRAGIPVRVLNTMRPDDPGTLVVTEPVKTERYAKSIVYKEDVNLITIASHRLMSAVQILSRAFEILSTHDIGVHMATTSEATVSLVTDRDYTGPRLEAALAVLADLGDASAERGKAIICVIGEELRGEVNALGRIFGRLAADGIKAKMVSQSASEINIAFLVDNAEIEASVKALHALMGE